jgi:hypothetical protein
MNKRRLLRLAAFLEELPPKRFDYSVWVGFDWKGAKDLSCGTTACALGWATTIPSFGLRLQDHGDVIVVRLRHPSSPRPPRRCDIDPSIWAAMVAFGLSQNEAEYLFLPANLGFWKHSSGLPATSSPKRVAKHIRDFVKRGGMERDEAVAQREAAGQKAAQLQDRVDQLEGDELPILRASLGVARAERDAMRAVVEAAQWLLDRTAPIYGSSADWIRMRAALNALDKVQR